MRSTVWGLASIVVILGVWWGVVHHYDRDSATLTVLDRNGQVVGTLNTMAGGRQIWTPFDQIPSAVIVKTINAEDRFFWWHAGINPVATAKAALANVVHGRVLRGGSTITQQLAKLLIQERAGEPSSRTVFNKMREAVLAVGLEAFHTKRWILERYLNLAYYGERCYGIAAASDHYYDRRLAVLRDEEIAQLVRLPRAPARYGAAIRPQRDALREEDSAPAVGRHFMDEVARRVVSKTHLATTTLDLALQGQLETAVRQLLAPRLQDDPKVTAAAVVIHVPTGDVRAMVGSRDYFEASIDGQFNAAMALRQPGSALKPFTYFAAFAKGLTPETMVPDEPTSFYAPGDADAAGYIPHNFDRRYHGMVTIRQALANSYNVPAVVVLNTIGVGPYQEVLRKFGLSSLTHSPYYYGLSLTLGSGEVSLLELTNAYAALARGGKLLPYRMSPNVPIPAATEVLPNAFLFAQQITAILSDDRARMKAFGSNPNLEVEDHVVAVKTGTSYEHRDNWTLGYTRDYAVGVWVGHADNTPLPGTTGASGAGPIWHAAMEYLVRGNLVSSLHSPSPTGGGLPVRRSFGGGRGGSPISADQSPWKLTSPLGNSIYRTRTFVPHQHQQIEAAALVRNMPILTLHWYLDDEWITATTTNKPKLWLSPTPGPHELRVSDDMGHEERVSFRVEEGI